MSSTHHHMQLPRDIIIGKGTINRIPELLKRLNITHSALIIAGKTSYELAGKRVMELLSQSGMIVDSYLVNKVTSIEVINVEKQIKNLRPSIVIAIGGGSKIDAAKLSSSYQNIPFISMPTTLSHDGIASPLASIKGICKSYSVMAQSPLAIIADLEILAQSPWRSVKSGCGDVISKYTAVKDWWLAHLEKNEYYGQYAASLALMSTKLVMKKASLIKPGNHEGLRLLLEALISCGVAMSIVGSSRPCSGSEHLFSHALDVIECPHAMHGEQCGVGSILVSYLYNSNWKRIKATLKKIGAPITAKELDVKSDSIIKALVMAPKIRPKRYTILHKLNLTFDEYKKVAKITGII